MIVYVKLFIEDEILARAHEIASRRGTSLNQMIRDYLHHVATDLLSEEILQELELLWKDGSGESSCGFLTRDELHERTR